MGPMKELYLEVTFRHGRPMAAYLYLPLESLKLPPVAKADLAPLLAA
jgi:hypothetical protein